MDLLSRLSVLGRELIVHLSEGPLKRPADHHVLEHMIRLRRGRLRGDERPSRARGKPDRRADFHLAQKPAHGPVQRRLRENQAISLGARPPIEAASGSAAPRSRARDAGTGVSNA